MDEQGEEAAAGRPARRGKKAECARIAWTDAQRAVFLDHLAATCNVSAAAEAAGVLPGSVYRLRRRDPAFRAEWGDALEAGYEMLETQLVGHALAGGGARTLTNGDADVTGAIDVDLALKLLGTHRGAMRGKPFRGGVRPKTATAAETNAALLKQLLRVEARSVAPDCMAMGGDVAGDGAREGRADVSALPAPR